MASERVLEICCDSIESAQADADGGADRIELCVDLAADGLTPPVELLRQIKGVIELPIFTLVRCRDGDFVFSAAEIDLMAEQIVGLRQAGADGIVCGALTETGDIDEPATRQFLSAAGRLPFTFHKGFDQCAELGQAMESLVGLGVSRVLTSGGARFAMDAIDRLAGLVEIGGESTQVLCGGGVRAKSLPALLKVPGLLEFHSAARSSVDDPVDSGEVSALRAMLDLGYTGTGHEL